jgi:hypothetical protein
MIDNEDECKSAVRYLNNRGSNLTFRGNESDVEYPYGCYKHKESWGDPVVYWNTHSMETPHVESNAICKQGE